MLVFTYKQFYIRVSRISFIKGLSILLLQENLLKTLNVIYPEVLANLL
jgi:hypothetical protein